MGNRIIAVNSNTYHGYSIEEALEGISRAGFHYVELTATKGWTEHVFPNQSFEYLESIKQKMEKFNLSPIALSGHCNLVDLNRREDFIKNIKLANYFGCRYIISSIGEAHLEDKAVEDDKKTAEMIRSFVPYLVQYNLLLVLECHGEHGTGEAVNRIVKLVNSDFVKINYDTANVVFYGRVDPADDLASCVENVAYMHLKDKAGEPEEWSFPELGAGNIRFDKIFSVLNNSRNHSPFSIEIEFTPQGAESIENVNKAVEASARFLRERGYVL